SYGEHPARRLASSRKAPRERRSAGDSPPRGGSVTKVRGLYGGSGGTMTTRPVFFCAAEMPVNCEDPAPRLACGPNRGRGMHFSEALNTALAVGSLESWLSLSTELASVAAPAKPFFWENKIFQKPLWVDIMFGLRVALCLLGALFVIAEVRARRMGVPVQKRLTKWIAIGMTALAFLTYF